MSVAGSTRSSVHCMYCIDCLSSITFGVCERATEDSTAGGILNIFILSTEFLFVMFKFLMMLGFVFLTDE